MKTIIQKAVSILKSGGLVAMPTETVYGLAADASNQAAVERIFAVKERPYQHPLIVHLAAIEQLSLWAREVPPVALKLAQAYWPGPLTLILKKQPHVLDIVTGAQDTVGIRIPHHPIAQDLLKAFGGGLAAPSANKFTHISPTTAQAVEQELGQGVDLILDGGECEVGLESTIVDMSGDQITVLRPGMLSLQAIAEVLGQSVFTKEEISSAVKAPGGHHLHYAPLTFTQLLPLEEIKAAIEKAEVSILPMACLVYSPSPSVDKAGINWVVMPQDPEHYAHELYKTLRHWDNQGLKRLLVEQVPESSEWDAIRDRLQKAAARELK